MMIPNNYVKRKYVIDREKGSNYVLNIYIFLTGTNGMNYHTNNHRRSDISSVISTQSCTKIWSH